MNKFIVFMTGAKSDTLQRAGHKSIQRYLTYSLLMFIPIGIWFGVVWQLSGLWYAGIIAAFVVFVFDRSIMSNSNSPWFNGGRALIAIMMGLVGSLIVDEIFFAKEIDDALDARRNAYTMTNMQDTATSENPRLLALYRQIKLAEQDVQMYSEAYQYETKVLGGVGPRAERARNAKQAALVRLDSLNNQLTLVSKEEAPEFGYLDKARVLWKEIAKPFGFNFFVALLIFVLAIVLEMMPLLFKWFAPKVYYEDLLDMEEDMARFSAHQRQVDSVFNSITKDIFN